MNNIILNTDSYKASHWVQYPPNTEKVFSYVESRGGDHSETMFFGLQMFLKEYLSKRITREDIEEAEYIFREHGVPFNKKGWVYIYDKYLGKLPVHIKAVPEGTVVPTSNILVSVQNTDSKCYWLTSYLETSMLRAIWYPTTVATVSYSIRKNIEKYLEKTADNTDKLPFMLHDFGSRGVSSKESAGIGGLAHLATGAMGTDTVESLMFARRYYDAEMPAYSIPASEHSTMTAWGKDGEVDAYRNMLRNYAKPGSLVAVVSDSYDIYNAVEHIWGEVLRQEVIDSGATVVVRPDSGDPVEVVLSVLELLAYKFGVSTNSKGYKVINTVKVIQGDGINEESIDNILKTITKAGYSADNMAFGMGGALLQHMNRDTQKFAMKASAIRENGEWHDIYKKPITDHGKVSKAGRMKLVREGTNFKTVDISDTRPNLLESVFFNGDILKSYTLEEVRNNARN